MENSRGMFVLFLIVILIVFTLFLMNSGKKGNRDAQSLSATPSVSQNQDTAQVQDVDELLIETLEAGDGDAVESGDTVNVHYTGTLLDGTKFDSSLDRGTPFSFEVGAGMVIQGWDKGLLGMKVGEKRKLTIPSELGYGASGAGSAIPGGAALIFEIELLSIE